MHGVGVCYFIDECRASSSPVRAAAALSPGDGVDAARAAADEERRRHTALEND